MINNIASKDNNISLIVNVRTWSRDSHGLYDYECTSTKNNNFKIKKDQIITRKKNEVRLVDETILKEEQDEEKLCKIYVDPSSKRFLKSDRYFFVNPISYRMNPNEENINNLQNKIWYIIKSEEMIPIVSNQIQSSNIINENEFAELKLNDIIKLGRVKYAVTEMTINNIKASIDQANPDNQVFNLIPEYM